jgi:antitoxin component YwqK of YwqJK toxin-antitoxin module
VQDYSINYPMKTRKIFPQIFFVISTCLVLYACHTNPRIVYPLERSGSMFYPDDGKIYNQWLGETVEGHHLADGWRRDSINGGLHKEVYTHPYHFLGLYETDKPGNHIYHLNFQYFYYSKGKAINGYHEIPVEDESNIVFACEFKSGMAHSPAAFFYLNGDTLAKGSMVNGEMIGEWVWYYTYPKIKKKGVYAKGRGKPISFDIYDPEGGSIMSLRYKSDRILEEYKEYAEGKLIVHKTLAHFEGSPERPTQLTSQVKNYHPNGQLASEGRVIVDLYGVLEQKTGIWKTYDQQGKLIKEEAFGDH